MVSCGISHISPQISKGDRQSGIQIRGFMQTALDVRCAELDIVKDLLIRHEINVGAAFFRLADHRQQAVFRQFLSGNTALIPVVVDLPVLENLHIHIRGKRIDNG